MLTVMLQIEPTTRCNLKCTYCTKKEPIRDLELNTLHEILNKHTRPYVIKLQGLGEPFLCRTLEDICKTARANTTYLTTITNGTTINYNTVQYFDRIMFSIDSLDEERYKLYRPQADLQDVLYNLHHVRELTQVGINQVITADTTKEDIQDIDDMCKRFNLLLTRPRIENWLLHDDFNVQRERALHGAMPLREPSCMWGKSLFYYDAWGRLHPCCIRMNDEFVVDNMERFMLTRSTNKICRRCPD